MNLHYKLWIYHLGTTMNLFESEISKLNLSTTAKETVIQLRKICLESEYDRHLQEDDIKKYANNRRTSSHPHFTYEKAPDMRPTDKIDSLPDKMDTLPDIWGFGPLSDIEGTKDTVDIEKLNEAKQLFLHQGGHSKIVSRLLEFLDDEWGSSGVEVIGVEEYDPNEDNFPRAHIHCDTGKHHIGIDVRVNSKGLLSYVMWDDDSRRNLNAILCEYRDVDPNTLDDRYELSKKYSLDNIDEMLEDISKDISSIFIWGI